MADGMGKTGRRNTQDAGTHRNSENSEKKMAKKKEEKKKETKRDAKTTNGQQPAETSSLSVVCFLRLSSLLFASLPSLPSFCLSVLVGCFPLVACMLLMKCKNVTRIYPLSASASHPTTTTANHRRQPPPPPPNRKACAVIWKKKHGAVDRMVIQPQRKGTKTRGIDLGQNGPTNGPTHTTHTTQPTGPTHTTHTTQPTQPTHTPANRPTAQPKNNEPQRAVRARRFDVAGHHARFWRGVGASWEGRTDRMQGGVGVVWCWSV
jgi:hypothetical protein